jgi:plastocyanin
MDMSIATPPAVAAATSIPVASVAVPAGVEQTVRIENFAFALASLTIHAGDTVRWTNADKAPHTATGDIFDSDILEQNGSFTFRFTQPGTYAYVCILHEGMAGSVIVLPAEGPAAPPVAAAPTSTSAAPISPATATAAPPPVPAASSAAPPPPHSPATAPAAAPAVRDVSIAQYAFNPPQLTIYAGDTVRWTNQDAAPHTATAGGQFDSGRLARGASFQFTFARPGTYHYVCSLHEGMEGSVIVLPAANRPAGAAAAPTVRAVAPSAPTAPPAAPTHPPAAPDAPAPANPPAAASSAAPATVSVSIQGFADIPAQITIRTGDTVRWTNQDSAAHTATTSGGQFNSGTLARGASYHFTFTQPGTYAYFCARHPEMTGQIVVTAGGGTAPGATAAPPAPAPAADPPPVAPPADDHGGHGGDDPPGDDHGGSNSGSGSSGDDNSGHGGGDNSGHGGGDDNSGHGGK